ncbi:hypothetical protein HBN50_16985 [Halobacteriovorax sp. GB3]|uniref:hypothetical protein n=1 Tax=Halobacteriovorax sp. GB3 TaxID=2719615 RepID=UPI00235F51D0|nr:hypothetical protein [Halobacteriovorax sp. GB3]MDD0854806.1 hypothetical protein [Halobacteriovorax sp. GB3]
MAAAQNLLMDLLRILTPEEINKLTSSSEGDKRVSLTDMMNLRATGEEIDFSDKANMAKILPFKRKDEADGEAEDSEIFAGKDCVEYIAQHYLKRELNDNLVDKETGQTVETSHFILNEKKRFTYSQSKLKGSEVLKLYQKNSVVDIEQEKKLKDDLSKSAQTGVLVNKRQF